MLRRHLARGAVTMATTEKNIFRKNQLLATVTTNIDRFTSTKPVKIEEHINRLYQLQGTFEPTIKLMVRSSGVKLTYIENFRFDQMQLIHLLSNMDPTVVNDFRSKGFLFIRCLGVLVAHLQKVQLSRLGQNLQGYLNSLNIILVAIKNFQLFDVFFPNRELKGIVRTLMDLMKAADAEVKAQGLRPQFSEIMVRGWLFLDAIACHVLHRDLEVGIGNYGAYLNYLRGSVENAMKQSRVRNLVTLYTAFTRRNGLIFASPFFVEQLEEAMFKKWTGPVGRGNPTGVASFLENKGYVLWQLYKKIPPEELNNEYLLVQKLIIDLPPKVRETLTLSNVEYILKLPNDTHGFQLFEVFRRLGDLFPQLARELLSLPMEKIRPSHFNTVYQALALKNQSSLEDRELILDLAKFFAQFSIYSFENKTQSLNRLADCGKLVNQSLLGHPFDLRDPQIQKSIMNSFRNWIRFITTGSTANSGTLATSMRVLLHWSVKASLKNLENEILALRRDFSQAVMYDLARVSVNTLITMVREGVHDDLPGLLSNIHSKLTLGVADYASWSYLSYFLYVLIYVQGDNPVCQDFLVAHGSSLIQKVGNLDFAETVRQNTIHQKQATSDLFRWIEMRMSNANYWENPCPQEIPERFRKEMVAALGQSFVSFNRLLSIKVNADLAIKEYPTLRSYKMHFWQIARMTYLFYGIHKSTFPEFDAHSKVAVRNAEYLMHYYASSLKLDYFGWAIALFFVQPDLHPASTAAAAARLNQVCLHIANSFCSSFEEMSPEKIAKFIDFLEKLKDCCGRQMEFRFILQRAATGFADNFAADAPQEVIISMLSALFEADALNTRRAIELAVQVVRLHNKSTLRRSNFYQYCVEYRKQMDKFLKVLIDLPSQPEFSLVSPQDKAVLAEFHQNLLEERMNFRDLVSVDLSTSDRTLIYSFRFDFIHFLRENGIEFKQNVNFLSDMYDFHLPAKNVFIVLSHHRKQNAPHFYSGNKRVIEALNGKLVVVHTGTNVQTQEEQNQTLRELIQSVTNIYELAN